ncbi:MULTISPECIES: phage major capsid protein, P2 family [unclassified Acinetobacter]|uniref:phage major capsid protein, P2 family n=1 Tax=unclassified Acinetobacter TaxID=196816 RepID=UPI0022AC7A43|nr:MULTISPECIES: phage major capsid protein, P2 family [unclassified Acinetobacter]WAU72941.1 phage major capsid protein, P2 family [Acinetobacter sp. TR11]WAU76036.1 phage major capsid protein, P2 family [Acinetobacter sp. TR3]
MARVVLNALTKAIFTQYQNDIAGLNGVPNVRENFTVIPAVEQRIIAAYQESDDFLRQINIYPVDNQAGEKIGMGVGTTIASTTDTRTGPRRPISVGETKHLDSYLCTQTNYDVAYKWSLLNAWRHRPEFKKNLAVMVTNAIALDKITIGFNGIYRAANSDREAFPLLQDVKRGWLQRIREVAPEQVYSGITPDGNGGHKITVGPNGEYKTLDGLVETAIQTFIAPQYRRRKDLVAITGSGVIAEKYLPLLDRTQDPTEQIAARTIYANQILGTLQPVLPPQFPENTIFITTLKNLSIYLQSGTLVRSIVVEPAWDRDVDYQSINEDYVVEDYDLCVLLENIEVQA